MTDSPAELRIIRAAVIHGASIAIGPTRHGRPAIRADIATA